MDLESLGSLFSTYAPLIGLSALVSGGISTFINYWINLKDFKKKAKIELYKEKIALYSYLIFQLDKMRFIAQALKKTGQTHDQSDTERYAHPDRGEKEKQTFDNITRTLENKYYLFKQKSLKEWMEATTLFFHPTALEIVPKLRTSLIKEYNNEITEEYEKLTGIKLEKKN